MVDRRTDFQHAITYTGQRIKGIVDVTIKVDGIRLLSRDGKIVTRNNKVPLGINALTPESIAKIHELGDVEVFYKDFATTQSILGTIEVTRTIPPIFLYDITNIEKGHNLYMKSMVNPKSHEIEPLLQWAIEQGHEGLVLHAPTGWYRVKPYYTADVIVTGVFEQTDIHGFNNGVLGGFTTNYGNVTAFSDYHRDHYWSIYKEKGDEWFVGKLMEVVYKELYPSGNFRYAVTFKRFRTDKDTESFDYPARITANTPIDLATLLEK